jgi:hypothetical protein
MTADIRCPLDEEAKLVGHVSNRVRVFSHHDSSMLTRDNWSDVAQTPAERGRGCGPSSYATTFSKRMTAPRMP